MKDREIAVQADRHEDERREVQAERSENTQNKTASKLNVFQCKTLEFHKKMQRDYCGLGIEFKETVQLIVVASVGVTTNVVGDLNEIGDILKYQIHIVI